MMMAVRVIKSLVDAMHLPSSSDTITEAAINNPVINVFIVLRNAYRVITARSRYISDFLLACARRRKVF